MSDSRETSMKLMEDLLVNKRFNISSSLSSDKEDTAFITMLTLTALRHLVYIRKVLKNFINKKLSSQNIVGQAALILGSTELLYMNTPDYAVINSYVNLVKKQTNRYIAGFVNAVLRKISQNKQELISRDTHAFFSHDFRTLLKKDYSPKIIDEIEKVSILEPALDITCNDIDSAKKLNGKLLPLGTIRLTTKGNISGLSDYKKGTWWVQDFSSSLPVKMLGNLKGKKVLELCAAPGGKTAQLLNAGAELTCLDVSAERIKTLNENLERLKMKPENIICADGLDFLQQTDEKFDVVLLDAPCSATGTLRRHPEVVHLKTLQDVEKQAVLQKKFLEKINNVLNPNAILLYCVCSLCKAEGEQQIRDFLKNNPSFVTVSLKEEIPAELSCLLTSEGWIRVLPSHLASFGGADGFFIACLKKEN